MGHGEQDQRHTVGEDSEQKEMSVAGESKAIPEFAKIFNVLASLDSNRVINSIRHTYTMFNKHWLFSKSTVNTTRWVSN